MIIDIVLFVIGFLGLLIGTITDFQKREVADWLNYSLVFSGIGLRLIYSVVTSDWWFFLIALILLGIIYLFGILMYYTGQWGGGDSKMLMGLSALFATYTPLFFTPQINDVVQSFFGTSFPYNLSFYFHFLLNSMIAGAVYGMLMTIILVFRFPKKFKKNFKKEYNKTKKYLVYGLGVCVVGIIVSFFVGFPFLIPLLGISFLALTTPWLLVFSKAVEKGCMIRSMNIKDLTEGEWIVKDVKIDGKKICGPKDLGITDKQIAQLREFEKKGKIKSVMVKIGIPFVPAFLFGFIITVIWGNLFLIFL